MFLEESTSKSELIPSPFELKNQFPVSSNGKDIIEKNRIIVNQAMYNDNDKFLVISGPCAFDFSDAILEYIENLENFKSEISSKIHLIYRIVPLKPRTQGGWRGTLQDDIKKTREKIVELVNLGYPIAMDILSAEHFSYFQDCATLFWIGARTVMSQELRLMASLFSHVPILFKNAMDGSIQPAIDAIKFAGNNHSNVPFLGSDGKLRIIDITKGNQNCSLILRGGSFKGKVFNNLDKSSLQETLEIMNLNNIDRKIMFDLTHSNGAFHTEGKKTVEGQIIAFEKSIEALKDSIYRNNILGFMVESYLFAGNIQTREYQRGVSLVDPTINIETLKEKLIKLSQSID